MNAVKIAVAVLLLAALHLSADWAAVVEALVGLHTGWLAAALLLFVPQTLLAAWRWQQLVVSVRSISFRESIRQTLVASAWNLVTPSKLGEFSKAALVAPRGAGQKSRAAGLVVLERIADVAALLALWGCGLAGRAGMLAAGVLVLIGLGACVGTRGWASERFSRAPRRPGAAEERTSRSALGAWPLATVALWSLHLLQIDLFLKAAGVFVPSSTALARIPAAIFAGLLPVSLWGMGTRDAALVWLFADTAAPATMAAVGLLTSLRYLVPGAAGILAILHRKAEAAAPRTAA